MTSQSHPLNGGWGDESLPTARHKGDRVSTASLGSSTKNSPRRDSLLQRHSKENRHAESPQSRSRSLRPQPSSRSDPLPPRSAPRRRTRRLSLGHRAQRAVTGAGERGWSLERYRRSGEISTITTANLSFRSKLWETISLPRRNHEEAQTWKKQSGSLRSRTRLHGNELWLRSRHRQEGRHFADSDGSRTWRDILRYR